MTVVVEKRPSGTYRVRVKHRGRVVREVGGYPTEKEARAEAAKIKALSRRCRLGTEEWIDGPSRKRATHVYLIEAVGTGRFKIGSSRNVDRRIASLRCASAVELVLLATWGVGTKEAVALERRLHKVFKGRRYSLEWFTFGDAETAKRLVDDAVAKEMA